MSHQVAEGGGCCRDLGMELPSIDGHSGQLWTSPYLDISFLFLKQRLGLR